MDEPLDGLDPGLRNSSEPDRAKPEPASGPDSPLARRILSHLLKHQGELIRFEASQWTAEFGILRALPEEDPSEVRRTLHVLAELRLVLRRTQYVVGYSDPKNVYVLTTAGRRKVLELPAEPASVRSSESA